MVKIKNKSILEEINGGLCLQIKIRSQRAKFFGHIMRKRELEYRITSAKVECTRVHGRHREKFTDSKAR